MNKARDSHRTFWRTLASRLGEGTPLAAALEEGAESTDDAALREAVADVLGSINEGHTLSDAMASRADAFTPVMTAMIRAGEVGGLVDVAARSIAAGLDEGVCPVPADADAESDPAVVYWDTLALMASGGVPLVELLAVLEDQTCDQALRTATAGVKAAVSEGKGLSDAMRVFGDVFPAEVVATVAAGEHGGTLDKAAGQIASALRKGGLESLESAVGPASSGPDLEAWTHNLLLRAVDARASDIHLEPTKDGRGRVRMRVDGVLHEQDPPPEKGYVPLVSKLKLMCGMDVAEHQAPQQGRLILTLQGRSYDFRVATVPSLRGERVTLRELDRSKWALPGLDALLHPDQVRTVRDLCHRPNGAIVVNGPAGSGKTTLLYSMLNEIDRQANNVMTVEEPVEYEFDHVTHLQVSPRTGFTYPVAVRSVLCQDPDVVMVGELRDKETVYLTLSLAMTGHLVMTTTHANSSSGALKRLLDVGIEPHMVSSTVVATVSTRLFRKLCTECRQPEKPNLDLLPKRVSDFIRGRKDAAFYAPKGCPACGGTGYRERTAAYEILLMTDDIRKTVQSDPTPEDLEQAAAASGMETLLTRALVLAAEGTTSIAEILRILPA